MSRKASKENKNTTIGVTTETINRLWSLKVPGKSYNDIIIELLNFFEKNKPKKDDDFDEV